MMFRNYERMAGEIKELAPMLASADPDEAAMALEETNRLKEERQTIWNGLLDMSIGGEDAARTRCVLEIRAGTGGEEAALFARDLYVMYKHHADAKGWKVEIMDSSTTERGGFKEIILGSKGKGSIANCNSKAEATAFSVSLKPKLKVESTLPLPLSP